MSTNPISLRYPFETEISTLPEGVQNAHRAAFQGLVDLNQAIVSLKGQIDANKTAAATAQTTAQTAATTAKAAASSSSSSSSSSTSSAVISKVATVGTVNNQSGVASYTSAQGDYGAFIVLNNAAPVAVTLPSLSTVPPVTLPWYTSFINQGTGTATLTPISGTINGAANVALATDESAMVSFDGTNWYAILIAAPSAGAGVTSLNGETGVLSLTSTGGTVAITTPTSTTINLEATGGGSGYLKGSGSIDIATSDWRTTTVTVTGATTAMTAIVTLAPGTPISGSGFYPVMTMSAIVTAADTVTVTSFGLAGTPAGSSYTIEVLVFP